MRSYTLLLSLVLLTTFVFAQNPNYKMGERALINGDFKSAVTSLEKALAADSNDVNTLYMLGYSYYHAGNYNKAVTTFNRVVSLKPAENSAYYYRGKARNIMANDTKGLSNPDREKLLLSSIRDFTKAIELNADDVKLYQNRAVAYRDYGVLKGQKIPNFQDKTKAVNAFKSCISDFEKVLSLTPGRKDITTQLADAKSYMQNLN
ncbi:tetratricopeptide repeat protein [Daejeonella lutea]|uniref:TPR repeat-containing protein n=1 Tax=Daejeonella lutea TaxID=572036 RepID=A0A1T5A2T2_9SPHI|nr:tetratricopeptide repeat protein [Daejeonella lutea]SKB28943.1 TPR repeat-containing protein [Daejeonella lutea]